MRFADITGNEDVVKALAGMVDSGKIPHAIMLHEDDGGGAFPLAQAFLQYLYCKNRSGGDSCGSCPSCGKVSKLIHPDIHYIFPVNTGRSVDFAAQWRELVQTNPNFTENELGEALGIEGKTALRTVFPRGSIGTRRSHQRGRGAVRRPVLFGGNKRARTSDPLLVRQMLSQLSYAPGYSPVG